MGQGLYTMLGWGVLTPPGLDEEERHDALMDTVTDAGGRVASETEPSYLVIPLAVDDARLQDWWQLAPLPASIRRCAPRRACTVHLTYAVPDAGHRQWAQIVHAYAAAGLLLGAPGLVLLNDWD